MGILGINSFERKATLYDDSENFNSSALPQQQQLFAAAQKATNTSEADWTIQQSTIEDWIKKGREGMSKADMRAGAGLTYAMYMGQGKEGDYEANAKQDREVLGFKEESVDEVVARAFTASQKPKVF